MHSQTVFPFSHMLPDRTIKPTGNLAVTLRAQRTRTHERHAFVNIERDTDMENVQSAVETRSVRYHRQRVGYTLAPRV